jgi:hypothetical protein
VARGPEKLFSRAHPDDENTQVITYLARDRGYRTAYLSLTRGDGGQNLLGPQLGERRSVWRARRSCSRRAGWTAGGSTSLARRISATRRTGSGREQPADDDYDNRGCRAAFYTPGMEHSPTSATGTGWERTAGHAIQRAAWEALTSVEHD